MSYNLVSVDFNLINNTGAHFDEVAKKWMQAAATSVLIESDKLLPKIIAGDVALEGRSDLLLTTMVCGLSDPDYPAIQRLFHLVPTAVADKFTIFCFGLIESVNGPVLSQYKDFTRASVKKENILKKLEEIMMIVRYGRNHYMKRGEVLYSHHSVRVEVVDDSNREIIITSESGAKPDIRFTYDISTRRKPVEATQEEPMTKHSTNHNTDFSAKASLLNWIKRLYNKTDLSQILHQKHFFLTASHHKEDKRALGLTYYLYLTRQHLATKDAVNLTAYELGTTDNGSLNIREVKDEATYELDKKLLVERIQSIPGRVQNTSQLQTYIFEVKEEPFMDDVGCVVLYDNNGQALTSVSVPAADPTNISFSFRPPHQPVFKPMKPQPSSTTDQQLQPFPVPPEIFMNPRQVVSAPALVADAVIVSIRHKNTGEVKYLQRVDTFMNDNYRFVFNRHVATATRFPCKTQQESSVLVSAVKMIRPDHEDYLIFVHPA